MRFTFIPGLVPCLMLTSVVLADSFEFHVKHDHILGSCDGRLAAKDRKIRYEAADGKHTQAWAYIDIQKVEVVSPTRLVLKTFRSEDWKKFEKDRVFNFSLVEGKLTPEHQEFFLKKLSRPMVARLVEKVNQSPTPLPVRHRHRLGGCEGHLSIEEDRLIYFSHHSGDNRVWTLRDIENIGSTDPYHLRVTTYNETFTFDLKSPLDPKTYDFLWMKIYRLKSTQVPELKSLC